MAASDGSSSSSNPRGHDRNKQIIKEYQDIIMAAQIKASEEVQQLLADAMKLLDTAGVNFTRAVEHGRMAFNRIHGPARDNYQKQFDMALEVQRAIVDPADQELRRITQSVDEMIKRAIQPIEQVYSDMLSEASNLTSGISTGQ